MKNISRIMTMVFMCFISLILFTSCKESIVNAVVQVGSYETTVVKGTEYDVSDIVVEYTYSNDEKVTVTAEDLVFVLPNTNIVTNDATLTITYKGYTFDVRIRVVATEADVCSISSFSSWSNTIFNNNTTNNDSSTRTGFYNPSVEGSTTYLGIEPRYVGTDNPFVLDLDIAGYDEDGFPVDNLVGISTNIKVELIGNNGSLTELTEVSTPKLSDMVSYEDVDAKFQFTKAAEGKAFKVTVEPVNKEVGIQTELEVVTELHVVSGFNVHNALELSVYDNSGRDYDWDGVPDWNEKKIDAGVDVNYVPSRILLQNDINITADDVPSTMFWSNTDEKHEYWDYDKNDYDAHNTRFSAIAQKIGGVDENGNEIKLEGSMVDRDHTGVYHFNFNSTNSNLELVGNYFTISASDLPRAVVETTGKDCIEGVTNRWVNTTDSAYSYMTTHSTLFCHTYYAYDNQGRITMTDANITQPTSINWKNINFTGNGTMSDGSQYSGSIILFKSYRVNSNIYNCISNNFAINYLMAQGDSPESTKMTGYANSGYYRIDYCKGYDAYQALLFGNGAKDMLVTNSEFVGSCGPAIITVFSDYGDYLDYLKEGNWDKNDFHPTNLNIVASHIESWVTGKEPWFMINAPGIDIGSLTGMLEGYLDGSFNEALKAQNITTNKTIYKDERINARVSTIVDGISDNPLSVAPTGYSRFFDTIEAYEEFYNTVLDTTEYGLQLNDQHSKYVSTYISNGPLVMADNKGSYIGTVNNYGVGPSETNTLGNSIYQLAVAQTSEELYAAIAAYQNAFDENADSFYLYTPYGLYVDIELFDRQP